jgi:zinc resistance-associated protein
LNLSLEENMFKPVIVATAALAIAGSSLVYAQQRLGGSEDDGNVGQRFEQRHRLSAEDMAAFTDARIAALKAGLELTPDQAKNWPPFEQALRDLAELRVQRMRAHQANTQQDQAATAPAATPFDRLARRADNMSKASVALKRIADAGTPLYQSLNDAQKNRFKILAHMLRPHHMFARNEGNGRGWRQGFGYGPEGERGGGWRRYQDRRFGDNDGGPRGPMHNLMQSEDQGSEL